ncbi:MAG: ribonuclease T [SAR86 cluster bacterium]|jgi:ribonuclease T|uniref:Ribonuclease T n=1 Tax=SAR86 cluster bacterium TaxID=2030880 RepID=A0A520MIF7_9GAMM|nr:MAG: ribonuclease T [SAR86 cluster bacterium]|tara:strand:- start:308 stop:892 length:585 start_codon:yes stop_codon:yes gene_type:complete
MLKNRFRKYLPVVVDLETGGFDYENSAVLEIAITLIEEEDNQLLVGETHRYHIEPYDGLIVEDESLEFTKIKLNHPLRNAVSEEIALKELFKIINVHKNKYECSRAILVGHNAHFDLSFLKAATNRNNIKKSPFHSFSVLDTVTLGALATNQTVLAKICESLNVEYDSKEAHSAAYDSDVTAKVFCKIINDFNK